MSRSNRDSSGGIRRELNAYKADYAIDVKMPLHGLTPAKGNAKYTDGLGNWFEDVAKTIPAQDDTVALQGILDYCELNKLSVYFPLGGYLSNSLFGNEIHMIGYTTVKKYGLQAQIFATSGISSNANYSTIIFKGGANTNLFNNSSATDKMHIFAEKMNFIGVTRDTTSASVTQTNITFLSNLTTHFMDCVLKNSLWTENCSFSSWKTITGDCDELLYENEVDYVANPSSPVPRPALSNLKMTKCCVSFCRFPVSNIVDSEVYDNTFNLCETPIVLKFGAWWNRIRGNRIEWNYSHGVYISQGGAIATENEIDRSGKVGMFLFGSDDHNNSIVMGNKFIRNCAYTITEQTSENSSHLVVKSNKHCLVLNNTFSKWNINDDGSGIAVPYYNAHFSDNFNCIFTGNELTGSINDEKILVYKDNANCLMKNNVTKNQTMDYYARDFIASAVGILATGTTTISVKTFRGFNTIEGIMPPVTLNVMVVKGGGVPLATNTFIYSITFVFKKVATLDDYSSALQNCFNTTINTIARPVGSEDPDLFAPSNRAFWQERGTFAFTLTNSGTTTNDYYVYM